MILFELFITFFYIGATTFGGGYAMVSMFQAELVEKKKWINEDELNQIIVIAESTPGPIALNTSTFVGYKLLGFWGALVGTLAVMTPPTIIILIISFFYNEFRSLEVVDSAFKGISVGVGILIILAGIKMLKKTKKTPVIYILIILSLVGTLLVDYFALNVSTIYFIIFGAIVGIITTAITTAKKVKEKEENK